ncbi:hypothetical protein [Winogradskyella sediminis]|uniref:hypothetical protein n=2 Tax=Winogradskyella sediminis TaxID=1382466 RepID=UPI000E2582E3|nr:hypothetical protein [Winogradskyella sediminis]REG86024.1 hypothetical protein C8N41_103120 [Winogradskyella sediminis]
MKNRISFLFLVGCITFGFCQSEYDKKYGHYESLNLGVGYSYSFSDSNKKDFHLLYIGLNKTNYGGRHGGGYQYGIGTEIGLNTKKFTIGPKISGTFYFQFIAIGTELITYTDFDQWTLRLVPFIGIGSEKLKLTINPQVILTNKNFQPVNKSLLNLSVNLSLDRKKVR